MAGIATVRGAEPQLAGRLDALLVDLGFALRHPFEAAKVREALLGDKKRLRGRQRWLLPMAIGHVVEVDDVTDAELNDALDRILR